MFGSYDLGLIARISSIVHSGNVASRNNESVNINGNNLATINKEEIGKSKTDIGEEHYSTAYLVDKKYLGAGNLMDLYATIREGKIPSMQLVLMSAADFANLLTLNMFHCIFDPIRLNPHASKHLIVDSFSAETRKGEAIQEEKEIGQSSKVEQQPSGEDDTKQVLVTREEKVIQSEQETRHIIREQSRAYRLQDEKSEISDVASARQAMHGPSILLKDKAIVEREIVTCQEHIVTRDGKETKIVAGLDIGAFIGRNGLYNQESRDSSGTISRQVYVIESPEASGLNDKLDTVDLSQNCKLVGTSQDKLEPQHITVENDVSFDQGYISYAPFVGSIANVASKVSYGAEIGAKDALWVALDIAPLGAISFVKLGAVKAVAASGNMAAAVKTGINSMPRRYSIGAIGKLEPNNIYIENGYRSVTDRLGRLKNVSGELHLTPSARDLAAQAEARGMGLPTDDAGHMIGARFGGPSGLTNLVPQNANLNRGAWKSMENEFAQYVRNGEKVNITVKPNYTDSNLRPDSFTVKYTINDGKVHTKYFENTGAAS
ncbi:DNA/RNA non-specific endonuclease [Desulfovibrio piger]|uniref:Type VII secretion system protein EssD-like domain-containing protein n=1 Tax=Desulfovibrio piger TaxID=901 RepID=A0A848CFQ2_9BACT|nr:DNA/RNA non-specific endonuclease [Desulfovibrio piger]NME53118.1 hypothetical protein [Desulfovibrio piger]